MMLPLTAQRLTEVAAAMRPRDREEIFATRFEDGDRLETAQALAEQLVAASRFGGIAVDDRGISGAAVGAAEMWPGVWSVWMFATDAWPRHAFRVSAFIRRQMMPALLAAGARRAECASLASYSSAHRWLAWLGAKPEAFIAGYGKNGEDFILFSWRKDDVRQQDL